MAITFPNSPSSGDTHTTSNGLQYTYDGEKWTTIGTNSAGTWTRSGTTVSLTTAGDDLNVDSGTLFVDASTNNVGVGESNPGDKLTVGSTSDASSSIRVQTTTTGNGEIRFGDSGSASSGYIRYAHNGNHLIFARDNVEAMRISSGGNVGIGLANPSDKLTVAGHINLPNVNSYIKGGGHNVLQVDLSLIHISEPTRPY